MHGCNPVSATATVCVAWLKQCQQSRSAGCCCDEAVGPAPWRQCPHVGEASQVVFRHVIEVISSNPCRHTDCPSNPHSRTRTTEFCGSNNHRCDLAGSVPLSAAALGLPQSPPAGLDGGSYQLRETLAPPHAAHKLQIRKWPVGPTDKASASGAGDSRFESWAGHINACAHRDV